jgi:hypothetical protein
MRPQGARHPPAGREGAEAVRDSGALGYGTGWGAVRGVLAAPGLPALAATTAHLAMVWGTEQLMLPALGVSPPATQWGAKEIAVDGWHHMVYAAATGAADELLGHTRWQQGGAHGCPPAAVAFDVVETLMSLRPLGARLEQAGLPASLLPAWFSRLLLYGVGLSAAGDYVPVPRRRGRSAAGRHRL